jgi:hypothetical protein
MTLQRLRALPLPGEVFVNEGEQVHPMDVIAEASVPGDIFMLDIAASLGTDHVGAKRALVRHTGEYLHKGDVVAQIPGAFPRLVRAPLSGRFAALHQGNVIFEVERERIQVRACLVGVVRSVIPEYGAEIETHGWLLQGMWGNGRNSSGGLRLLENTDAGALDPSILETVEGGQVIAVETCDDEAVLLMLAERNPAGLIFGSLAGALAPAEAASPVPVVVVQGFGPCQPDSSIFEGLQALAGQTACLSGVTSDSLAGHRPEVIIPTGEGGQAETVGIRAELRPGQKVRLFSGKRLGEIGEVKTLPDDLVLFESGLEVPAAVVELGNGEKVTIPQQNVVIVG